MVDTDHHTFFQSHRIQRQSEPYSKPWTLGDNDMISGSLRGRHRRYMGNLSIRDLLWSSLKSTVFRTWRGGREGGTGKFLRQQHMRLGVLEKNVLIPELMCITSAQMYLVTFVWLKQNKILEGPELWHHRLRCCCVMLASHDGAPVPVSYSSSDLASCDCTGEGSSGPCHPYWRPGWSSCLLVAAWPRLSCYGHFT